MLRQALPEPCLDTVTASTMYKAHGNRDKGYMLQPQAKSKELNTIGSDINNR